MCVLQGHNIAEELVGRAARLALKNIAQLASAQAELAALDGVTKRDFSHGGPDPAALANIEAIGPPETLLNPSVNAVLSASEQSAAGVVSAAVDTTRLWSISFEIVVWNGKIHVGTSTVCGLKVCGGT